LNHGKKVASLQTSLRDYQNGEISKTGAYTFVESIMAPEADEFLKRINY
jgi:hypothetical protein